MQRPRCSAYLAVSIDGYISGRDDDLDWLQRVQQPGEDYGYGDFMTGVDTVIMGRRTWDVVSGFEEYPFPQHRLIVLTNGVQAPRAGVTFLCGPLGPLLEQLHEEGTRRIYVDGGQTIRSFLDAGFLDEITISYVPVLLGAGVRLFETGHDERTLVHRSTRTYASGLVQVSWSVV